MMVMTPSDENECRQLLTTAFQQDCPTAVRYPRGAGVGVATQPELAALPVGKGEIRREGHARAGQRVAILAFGSMLHPALTAAEQLDATVANLRFVKPLDVELVKQLAASHDYLVTVEEGATMGGAGGAVLEALSEAGIEIRTLVLGLPDKFIDHGDPAFLLSQCGLDAAGIEHSVRERFGLAAQPVKVATRVA
jgi:1-deoxy-D-xylulose-5-phosphate synthase